MESKSLKALAAQHAKDDAVLVDELRKYIERAEKELLVAKDLVKILTE